MSYDPALAHEKVQESAQLSVKGPRQKLNLLCNSGLKQKHDVPLLLLQLSVGDLRPMLRQSILGEP